MNYFKSILIAVILGVTGLQPTLGWSALKTKETVSTVTKTLPWAEVVEYAKQNLPLEAKLVQNPDGFVYLDVDNAYIHDLYPFLGLTEEGYKKPPYFRRPDGVGAHISVFYVYENVVPKEIDQTFTFELEKIVIVHPTRDASYAVLQVKSPQLEQLRKKYGLRPKLNGHEFHITLAKKSSGSKQF